MSITQNCIKSMTSVFFKIRTLQKKSFLNSHKGCLSDGFKKPILQSNDCLSLRLDADVLSITRTSSGSFVFGG